jgi:hypothetical protein
MYNSPKWNNTIAYQPVDGQQRVVYPPRAILFGNKRECNTVTCNNPDTLESTMLSKRHQTQKTATHASTYMKHPEKAKLQNQKVD